MAESAGLLEPEPPRDLRRLKVLLKVAYGEIASQVIETRMERVAGDVEGAFISASLTLIPFS